ncbi:MAG: protein translocase subunit SecF [Calditrichaeota bacterium]|nr:MAG: protein translocase subunit SecF [Calditrichota bacterium]
MQFIKKTNIDFLAKRKIALIISGFLILAGFVTMIAKGGPDYSIDFLGGTEIHVRFNSEIKINKIRDALNQVGYGTAEIKNFGNERDVLIRVEKQQESSEVSDAILSTLTTEFPQNTPTLLSVDAVGPKIGSELRTQSILAVFFALLLILIYVWLRFEFVFGIGAIVALFHDVLFTLGVFSVLGLEISLSVLAAFFTIVGYSLNDTIVVFDRIRENLKSRRRDDFFTVINVSINQSLSRTVITSLTTFVVVLVLYTNGGEVLHNFSFALLVGVVVGTYSSVFIATPVVAEWGYRQAQAAAKSARKSRK